MISRATAFLLDTGDAATIARRLRHLRTSELDGVPAKFLRQSARNLRAASYSLRVAADRFDHRADVLEHEETTTP